MTNDLYQKVEAALADGDQKNIPILREVLDRVFPIFAGYVKEKGVVLGREVQGLEGLFRKPIPSIPAALQNYTFGRSKEHEIDCTNLYIALQSKFGRFDRIDYSQNLTGKHYRRGRVGHKYSGKSLIFYSSEKELNKYLVEHVTRANREIRGRSLIVLNCNLENSPV